MLSRVEHEKSFITSGPVFGRFGEQSSSKDRNETYERTKSQSTERGRNVKNKRQNGTAIHAVNGSSNLRYSILVHAIYA